MTEGPPTSYPPIVFSVDYRGAPGAGPMPGGAEIRDGRFQLRSATPGTDHGFPTGSSFRDVIVEAELALLDGSDDCYYGLFLRQADASTYYTFAMSPGGLVWVRLHTQHRAIDIAHGPLAPDMRFHRGAGARNRFAAVTCGPCLTVLLNGMVITGTLVDPSCKEGFLGFYLHHGASSQRAGLAADWLQVRAIFPWQHGGTPPPPPLLAMPDRP